jgi:hypothetical protein
MSEKRSPWKEPMVWLLIGLPTTAVIASLVTAWIASNGADPLVNEPHHKVGLGMQAGQAPDQTPK